MLHIQMPVILNFFIARDFRRTPNQTNSDVDFFQIVLSRENHKKELKGNQG